jgi:hypothetical protein
MAQDANIAKTNLSPTNTSESSLRLPVTKVSIYFNGFNSRVDDKCGGCASTTLEFILRPRVTRPMIRG